MKKIICLLSICLILTGCVSGTKVPTEKTEYSIMLNSGSCFVFTFKDPIQMFGIYRINMW